MYILQLLEIRCAMRDHEQTLARSVYVVTDPLPVMLAIFLPSPSYRDLDVEDSEEPASRVNDSSNILELYLLVILFPLGKVVFTRKPDSL
jgi:hypothetical protein